MSLNFNSCHIYIIHREIDHETIFIEILEENKEQAKLNAYCTNYQSIIFHARVSHCVYNYNSTLVHLDYVHRTNINIRRI